MALAASGCGSISATQTLQTPTGAVARGRYVFDGGGRLQDLYHPAATMNAAPPASSGPQYRYSYDLAGRPTGLTHWAEGSWVTDVQNVTYNAAGQLTEWYEGAWQRLTRSYNEQRGWVTNITARDTFNGVDRLNFTYGYYANGQVQTVTDAINPGQSVSSYEYDELSRLKKATATNWTLQWSYDEFGNRLTQSALTGTPPQITLSYGESTNRIRTANYQYDLNGNLTALPAVNGQPALSIGYDVFDRATTINGTTAKYDAFGRRIARVMGGNTRVYFYGSGGQLLAEYDGTNQTRTVVYFAGHRLGQWTDRTGSVRYSMAGGVSRHYYPFGEEITTTAGDQHKFAELYRDADTGLDRAEQRF